MSFKYIDSGSNSSTDVYRANPSILDMKDYFSEIPLNSSRLRLSKLP